MESVLSGQPAIRSAQTDRFVRERLPPPDQWPQLLLPLHLSGRNPLNCVHILLDAHIAAGRGDRLALASDSEAWSYAELYDRVCRMAQVMVRDHGVIPGNRVLLLGANSPTLVALWLATQRAGAVAVTTMPLLRARELATILETARPALAVCESGLASELTRAIRTSRGGCRLVTYDNEAGALAQAMRRHRDDFVACDTMSDDAALIGFTSGTTGRPKATVHFHRDVIVVCEGVAGHVIRPEPDDVFIGTSPLAFTFGLGGLALFPLFGGAATVLNARYSPESLLDTIAGHRTTVCFTVPTFYQRMARIASTEKTVSLRMSVSSGEALPVPVRTAWRDATGQDLTELLGSTEMLHAFAGATGAAIRPGLIGPALPGYELAILDGDGEPVPNGQIGRLAVRGPTGCRYLDDPRQTEYVQNGWNVTGDGCVMDDDGYLRYHARLDEMIICSGYNISATEVENVLLEHPMVLECAVTGTPDPARGEIVTAFVVPKCWPDDVSVFTESLQQFVRSRLAPYKYPRKVRLLEALPRNESGKIRRLRLREQHA